MDVLITLILVIIPLYICISNHLSIYLKKIQLYLSIIINKVREKKEERGMLKRYRSQPEKAPNNQSWNDLSNKINNDNIEENPQKKVRISSY